MGFHGAVIVAYIYPIRVTLIGATHFILISAKCDIPYKTRSAYHNFRVLRP